MRHGIAIPVLAGLLGLPACTTEPAPSDAPSATDVTTTATADHDRRDPMTMPAHEGVETRIPIIDREAPETVETATFALG